MIYSNKYEYIYISIPKTASSAMSNLLIEQYDGRYYCDRHDNEIPKKFNDYFKFTIIRHPFFRALSATRHYLFKFGKLSNIWESFHFVSIDNYLNNLYKIYNPVVIGQKIQPIREVKIQFDCILTYENLKIQDLYFIKSNQQLPKINMHPKIISQKIIDQINNESLIFMKKDYERFEYRKIKYL